jgi:hypothetical protein
MAMEGQFSNPLSGTKPEAHRRAQIVSELSIIGVISGISLAVGLLVLAVPFSEQIAISLSLLS